MANLKQTYLASDQMDYRHDTSITKADANKGVAVALVPTSGAATASANRPQVKKVSLAADVIVGALVSVGDKGGCNVVKRGRFILQAATAYAAADFGKTVIGTTTAGKVEAGAVAKFGDIVIIGDATDAIDGIGAAYLCEYC